MKSIVLYTLSVHLKANSPGHDYIPLAPQTTTEVVKIYPHKPHWEEVAKDIGITRPATHREAMTHLIENQESFYLGDDHYYSFKSEKYQEAGTPKPKLDAAAWESAYRAEKLKVIDLSVELQKLQSNWEMFSEEIIRLFEKQNPKEETDRDRFHALIVYLNPEHVTNG